MIEVNSISVYSIDRLGRLSAVSLQRVIWCYFRPSIVWSHTEPTRSNQIKSNNIKPYHNQMIQNQNNQIKSSQIKSNQVKSSQIKSNQIKSNQIKAQQGKAEQNTTKQKTLRSKAKSRKNQTIEPTTSLTFYTNILLTDWLTDWLVLLLTHRLLWQNGRQTDRHADR